MHVQRELKGLQQTTMTTYLKLLCSAALLLCMSAAKLHAQVTGESSCFAVRVRLNGKPVAGPHVITFKTEQMEQETIAEAGCFKVPPTVLKEKTVDVLFTVPGNKIHLSTIRTGFLAGPWDIELEDKRFGKGVVLTKHARTRDACAVVFHVGEPDAVPRRSSWAGWWAAAPPLRCFL
jgi:hypothetical protein